VPIANPIRLARKLSPILLAPAIAAALETGKSVPTTTVLTITSPITIYYGQTVKASAEVSSADSSKFSGTITSCDGATSNCTLAIAPSASCPQSAGERFAAGSQPLTAAYSGDALTPPQPQTPLPSPSSRMQP